MTTPTSEERRTEPTTGEPTRPLGKHLSPRDVAAELGVSLTTAYRIFRDDRELKAFAVRGALRVSRECFDAWVRLQQSRFAKDSPKPNRDPRKRRSPPAVAPAGDQSSRRITLPRTKPRQTTTQ
jgi:hypothetical protein